MKKHNKIFNMIGILSIATFLVHSTFVTPSTLGAGQKIIAIKGGTVLTMAGHRISHGIVLIKGEKIKGAWRWRLVATPADRPAASPLGAVRREE